MRTFRTMWDPPLWRTGGDLMSSMFQCMVLVHLLMYRSRKHRVKDPHFLSGRQVMLLDRLLSYIIKFYCLVRCRLACNIVN